MPNQIVTIHAVGNRIIVGDIQESFFYVRYKRQDNQLIIFADDTNPRWLTTACLLDCNTAAGADKFGNISIVCIYNFYLFFFSVYVSLILGIDLFSLHIYYNLKY